MTRIEPEWSLQDIYEEIEERGVGLTAWEMDFIEDVGNLLALGEELTDEQEAKLREIAEDRLP